MRTLLALLALAGLLLAASGRASAQDDLRNTGATVAPANFPTPACKEALKKAAAESLRLMTADQGEEPRAEVRKAWATPTDGGFTYHGSIQAMAMGPDEKFSFYVALRFDKAPDYAALKQPGGGDLIFEAQTFVSTAADLKPSFEDVKFNVVADSFRQYAELAPGTHRVRAYWAVYHWGKKAYLTGDEAWKLGAVFTVEKAADGGVRLIPPADTAPGPAPGPGPGPRPEAKYQDFRDPSFQRAFTAQVPAGWKVRGGTQMPRPMTTTFLVEATSPDGQVLLRLRVNEPALVHFDGGVPWPLPPTATHWPITGLGQVPIVKYQPGAEYVVATELPQGPHESLQIGKKTPWPFLAETLTRLPGFEQVDAGEVAYTFRRDGRPFGGGALAVTRKFTSQIGAPSLWHCLVLALYEAPPEREQEARTHLVRLANTFRLDPAWVARQDALVRKSVGILMEAGEHTARITSEAFWKRQGTYDGIFQTDADVRRGVVQLRDARTGEEYTMENTKPYYWILQNGERVGTDDPTPPRPDAESLIILDIRQR